MKYEERLRTESLHIIIETRKTGVKVSMKRKLIIDGNAVYEIDEDCMLKRGLKEDALQKKKEKKNVMEEKNVMKKE